MYSTELKGFFFWPALMTGPTTTIALVRLNLGRTSHMFATETHTHTHWLSPQSCLKNTPSNFISESHPVTLQRFPNPAVIFTRLPYPPALVLMHHHVPGCGLRECRHNTTPDEETCFFFNNTQYVAEKSDIMPEKERSIRAEALARQLGWSRDLELSGCLYDCWRQFVMTFDSRLLQKSWWNTEQDFSICSLPNSRQGRTESGPVAYRADFVITEN